MDGFINSKIEKQTIYEIYRACRLCGAGAGYKMPIIQNVVSLDGAEVELKQKIRECVQIEVHQDDKMPPLICELCVDKVNDFYEFLEMCRHTNKRTRLRLGLPPQALPRGAPDAGDCILGVTEPVFLNDDSSEHSSKSKSKSNKSGKNKKELKVIISNNSKRGLEVKKEARSLRSKQPSPPRLRGTKRYHDEDVSLSKLQKSKRLSDPAPKSILKKEKEIKSEDDSLLSPRLKRSRDKEVLVKVETQNKKVKIQAKPVRTTRTSPNVKSKSPPPVHKCKVCRVEFSNPKSLNNHMRSHAYKQQAKPIKKESKEIKCTDCKKSFPNRNLLNIHKCPKQGGDCNNCNRHFYSQKSFIRHKRMCVEKKKEAVISPRIRRMLKPLQVRIARCDPLFNNVSGEHYDVSEVTHDYGLDKTCIYPYLYSVSSRIKFEPGYMVNINDDIRQAFDADKYVHWDSDDTESDVDLTDNVKRVDSLTAISLKTLFSKKCLGKVPKKRRKVKAEKAFDSILNASEFDTELKRGIDDLIESLDEKIDSNKSKDNDSLFGDENPPAVTNDDFDSLFNDKGNDTNDIDKINDQAIRNDELGNNESQNNEESSKDQIEISVNKDSSENVEDTENIDNTDVNISKDDVNILENNDKDTEKVNDLANKDKSTEEKLDDNLDYKENTQIVDSNEKDIIAKGTEFDTDRKILTENLDGTLQSVQNDDKTETEATKDESNKDSISETNERIQEVTGNHRTDKINGDTEEKFDMDDLEDLSDSEMDDKKLMAALDAQIGDETGNKPETEAAEKRTDFEPEKETAEKRIGFEEKDTEKKIIDDFEPCSVKSADLESISDGEFNLNE